MNEFEIQRGLRQMNTPRVPQADLWSGIAARIAADAAAARAPARRRRWFPFAAAAGMLLAVGGGITAYALHQQRVAAEFIASTGGPLPVRVSPRDARDVSRAPGGDPRLLGAAVVLDAAHAELEQALEQRPDAVFLVSLLNRTNARRMKLEHYGARAG
ncbi:hypothetical protein [Dokdonella sp.]|uniref:hypothetical protein n=1 Tax=Dokdonella sp. TaxID=2291710 RepID=UPI002F3FFDCC